MANNAQNLRATDQPIDYVLTLGYPTTAFVEVVDSYAGQLHRIWDNGGVAPSTTVCANAPNGSVLFDTTSTHHIYIKSGAVGSGNTGTWGLVA
ncbi:MAG TPA: hypothetical protein VKI62_09165 [Bacteroidota bacterium]|nr:hypothetical protein [Bacteroidota bacterium]